MLLDKNLYRIIFVKRQQKIVRLSGREQFKESLEAAVSFIAYLQTKYEYALKAIETVKHLLENKSITGKTYSHKSAASMLHSTEETLRNWKRNHVYTVEKNPHNRRLYIEHDIQKLLIIRILRSAHFSITSIAD